ncbi:GNAT family N-acetyltransferase [Paenibacillus sp. HN-1]|uniref:GNAT family N-acetyltransferase n=1 Tax=Paenibacillus TaxID=44249 RepID=UPI001CA9F70D|nr:MULTISPECIES: GNAT family N-acetyltransferase [Paenibacillus]MBY9081414.1 GNAT family N-acetyltransferase [Paenibacillus sp. CGMCC 1.18879]MBY9084934.1 GNAT family N-acetyltransferase [Paenibacillus sinensis]
MNPIQIRHYAEEDGEVLSALIRENLLKVNSLDYPDNIIQNMYSLFTSEYISGLAKSREMLVAVDQDRVIGTASLQENTVYTVFVDGRYHKQGVGRMLVGKLERMALRKGIDSLQVPSSVTAQNFYANMGYIEQHISESERFGRSIVMAKQLNPVIYREHRPSGSEFTGLVESAGWLGIAEKGATQLEEALSNSWYTITAFHDGRVIGMGRIISDGVLQALICDLIIRPDYQGDGVGSGILIRLLERCAEREIPLVQLFAAADKADFYKRFGFEERPAGAPGMRWVNRDFV